MITNNQRPFAHGKPCYKDKKPLFSPKEIIFRSGGRAKVISISSRAQVIILSVLLILSVWSYYSYHIYHRSGRIISRKELEISATREAYVDLMTEFVTLHNNISEIMQDMDKSSRSQKGLEVYKKQASIVEEKIKQITKEKDWIDPEQMSEKITLSEAVLQRDIAASERDVLKKQIDDMESVIEDLKSAELEVLAKISSVTNKELSRIKGAFSTINGALKSKGLYFNALANKKSSGKGGPYIPATGDTVKNKKINDKISQIFEDVDNLEYYKEVIKTVPMGKPVWSYWVTSPFGARSDPFHGKKATHKGIDLASRTGNKVKVMAKGKVLRAEYSGAYGNLVEVEHGNGFRTKYAHLHKIYVKKGEYVSVDQAIGEVGSTGRSTGPHLHYEVLYRGINVNPMPFIQAKS